MPNFMRFPYRLDRPCQVPRSRLDHRNRGGVAHFLGDLLFSLSISTCRHVAGIALV